MPKSHALSLPPRSLFGGKNALYFLGKCVFPLQPGCFSSRSKWDLSSEESLKCQFCSSSQLGLPATLGGCGQACTGAGGTFVECRQVLGLSFLPGNGGCSHTALALLYSVCLVLCPAHWTLLHGICWLPKEDCLGFWRVKNHHVMQKFWAAFCSTCPHSSFSFLPCLMHFAHLKMLWWIDLSYVLVCRLGIVCWDVGVQFLVISGREISRDPSCCHTSDVTPDLPYSYSFLYNIFFFLLTFSISQTTILKPPGRPGNGTGQKGIPEERSSP